MTNQPDRELEKLKTDVVRIDIEQETLGRKVDRLQNEVTALRTEVNNFRSEVQNFRSETREQFQMLKSGMHAGFEQMERLLAICD